MRKAEEETYDGDMKKMCLILLVLLTFLGCARQNDKEEENGETETKQLDDGSFISTMKIGGHEIFIYQPEDLMASNVINYGYSAPLLLVFADCRMDEEEAVSFIREKNVDRIAQKTGGFVVFVNPSNKWDKEEEGIYEKIMERTMVGQEDFSHGLIYDAQKKRDCIFASPACTCVYGYGKGADYIASHYLKQTKGTSSMSSLGSDDITMTGAVLEKLSVSPVIEDRDIIVVSLGNENKIDEEGIRQSDHYNVSDGLFDQNYEEYIAGYQHWKGEITETYYPGKDSLEMTPLVFEVTTSPDNKMIRTSSHEVGAVVFCKENGGEKRPLLLCFHGGGDTAIATACIAGWPEIAAEEDFILCAVEMHVSTTATETMEIVEKLKEIYPIDDSRIYATGFSMGGIKTWDLYQEYPDVFAALAPMGATVDVGKNVQFSDSPSLNEEIPVPLFYAGGENSQLQELPFQGLSCCGRINHLFKVNQIDAEYELSLGNRSEWKDSVFGYEGDIVEELTDGTHPESLTRIRYYRSRDGRIYTALCSISRHQHEVRPFTCRKAWEFMKRFRRVDGEIVIDE